MITVSCFSIVAIFLIGMLLVFGAIVNTNVQEQSFGLTASSILATNTAVSRWIAATQTVKAWTPTPSPTMTPG